MAGTPTKSHPLDKIPTSTDAPAPTTDAVPAGPPQQDRSNVRDAEPGGGPAVELTTEQERDRDRQILASMKDGGTGKPLPASNPTTGSPTEPGGEDPSAPKTPDTFRQEGSTQDAQQAPAESPERREAAMIATPLLERAHGKEFAGQLIATMSTEQLEAQATRLRKQFADTDRLANQVHNTKDDTNTGGDAADVGDVHGDMDLTKLPAARRKLVQAHLDKGDADMAAVFYEDWFETERRSTAATQQASPDSLVAEFRPDIDVLAGVYPKLAAHDEQVKLVEKAGKLLMAGAFDDDVTPQQALNSAAAVLYGAPTAQEHQIGLATQRHHEVNGQPTPPRGKGSNAPATMTDEQADKEAYRRLQRGEDPNAVNSWRRQAVA